MYVCVDDGGGGLHANVDPARPSGYCGGAIHVRSKSRKSGSNTCQAKYLHFDIDEDLFQ